MELQAQGVLRVEDGNHGESRPRSDEFVDHGVAFVRAADLRGDQVDFTRAERINNVARERITKGIGLPGDILFSHKGTVGKLAVAPPHSPPFVCSPQTTFWRVTDSDRLDPRFLLAFMRSRLFQAQWHARKGETDMADYVSLTAQRSFLVPLPDIGEQRSIGDLLHPIDERVTSLREQGASLHALAERLFRRWIVDLALTRPEDESLLPGEGRLRARLVASVDGQLPQGWCRSPLDSVGTFRNGIAMQKYPPGEGDDLPVLKIAQLRDESLARADRASTNVPVEVLVEDGDVIFSWSGTLLVKLWTGGPAVLNQHLFKVTSPAYPRWFIYFWTRAHLPAFQAIANDKKTTMGHIKRAHLTAATVNLPDQPFLDEADAVLGPLLERYVLCHLQARRLEALRDRLLRALMSGEVAIDARTGTLEAV